jgi:hypothetical protein
MGKSRKPGGGRISIEHQIISWVGRTKQMKKLIGVGALLLAGLLLMSGTGWLATRASAQSGPGKLSDQEWQELQQKRQKEWEDSEKADKRRENTYQRRKEAEQRQRDAEKRQREVERQLQELQK